MSTGLIVAIVFCVVFLICIVASKRHEKRHRRDAEKFRSEVKKGDTVLIRVRPGRYAECAAIPGIVKELPPTDNGYVILTVLVRKDEIHPMPKEK